MRLFYGSTGLFFILTFYFIYNIQLQGEREAKIYTNYNVHHCVTDTSNLSPKKKKRRKKRR